MDALVITVCNLVPKIGQKKVTCLLLKTFLLFCLL